MTKEDYFNIARTIKTEQGYYEESDCSDEAMGAFNASQRITSALADLFETDPTFHRQQFIEACYQPGVPDDYTPLRPL